MRNNWLITLIEKWRKIANNSGTFGTLQIDLSKAFKHLTNLPHGLVIAKLDAYRFQISSFKLI